LPSEPTKNARASPVHGRRDKFEQFWIVKALVISTGRDHVGMAEADSNSDRRNACEDAERTPERESSNATDVSGAASTARKPSR
jgi:hypothetical protein